MSSDSAVKTLIRTSTIDGDNENRRSGVNLSDCSLDSIEESSDSVEVEKEEEIQEY